MLKMGIKTLYRKPNTSRKHPQHKVYPYLLRKLAIERANHVWAMDIFPWRMAGSVWPLSWTGHVSQPSSRRQRIHAGWRKSAKSIGALGRIRRDAAMDAAARQ